MQVSGYGNPGHASNDKKENPIPGHKARSGIAGG